jgi:hypothetical protein
LKIRRREEDRKIAHSTNCIRKQIDKAIPLQALIDPEGSRRLGFPDFKTIGT